ncbi:hypothetical protein RBG61_06550 [Paludicola sp. MB14-C6]|uniref:type II secretion system F family protein n=1 Tax=Paludihabitans sp. MB14-C6 TaxID=3070656 RepID=UPI0027DDCB21|nr:hypothetical protein [Paludicola sp. MB14-C6]WMJ24321.1 hypothetical protein RBG61_06550 [Paludicola sp. MB14-C6]
MNHFLLGFSFIFTVAAILIFFKVNSKTIQDSISFSKKKTLKQLTIKKKQSRISNFTKSIYTALKATGQLSSLYYIILFSFLLIIFGIFSGISFDNIFLAPVLGIALASLPFIYVRIQYVEYKALLLDEMETGLSVITSSYERCENIPTAFKENIDLIQAPLHDVFERFIYAVDHNVNVISAIDIMKSEINHPIFLEWCDNLKRCSVDRSLKATLRPTVDRITDIKVATSEAKNILFEANNEFRAVSILSLIFVFLTYYLVPKTFNMQGKIPGLDLYLAIDILMLFFFSIRALLLTKDVDFDI